MVTTETLEGKYGEAFPYKLVKSFIENPTNFAEIEGYIDPTLFDNSGLGLGLVVKAIKNFHEDRGFMPGYSDLEYYIKETIKDQGDMRAAYTAFKKITESKMMEGIDTVATQGIDFIKQQEAMRQLDNARKSIKASGYSTERIVRIIEGLQGIENSGGSEYFSPVSLLEKVLAEDIEEKVITGIKELDEHLGGGVPKGTTNMLLAGTGAGKTTLFSIMACRTAQSGRRVLYISFEDKDTDFARKFYSVVTGEYTSNFYKGSEKYEQAAAKLNNLFSMKPSIKERLDKDYIRVLRLPNGDTTVDNIKNAVRRMIVGGWRPDVVFIDYLSCIKPSTDGKLSIDKEYAAYERCVKRLDAFAQEENFVLWLAQQFNREGCKFDSSYNRLGSIQGSFRVTQTASVILSLIRDTDDTSDYNRVNIYLDKSRFSSLTQWEGVYLNNGTCQIDLSSGDSLFESNTTETKPEWEY